MKFAMGPPIFASSRTHDIASASPSRAAAAHAVVASFAYLLISNCSLILRRNWAPLLRAAQRSCACPGVASASWCARSTSMKSTSTLASAALTCVRCVSVSESGRVCCAALRIFAAKPTRRLRRRCWRGRRRRRRRSQALRLERRERRRHAVERHAHLRRERAHVALDRRRPPDVYRSNQRIGARSQRHVLCCRHVWHLMLEVRRLLIALELCCADVLCAKSMLINVCAAMSRSRAAWHCCCSC